MRQRLARFALLCAIVWFGLGLAVLCACPWWYVVAAGLAGLATSLGAGSIRRWGTFWIVASLVSAGVHWYGEGREREKLHETRSRFEATQRTNAEAGPAGAQVR